MCVNEWTRVECRRREEKRDNEMKVNWPQEGNVKVSTKELVIDVHLRHQRQH